MGKFVDGFNEMSGTGGSEVGKGQSFQSLVAEQSQDQIGNAVIQGKQLAINNAPHLSRGELGVDFRIEHYDEDGVVDINLQRKIYKAILEEGAPFYGVIPNGHPLLEKLKEKGINATVFYGKYQDRLFVGTDVPANYQRLPDKWLTSAEVTWGNEFLKEGGSDV